MEDAARDYEQQQAALRKEHGYDDSLDDGTHFDDLKIPEVNPEVYRDVDPYLFHGFLTLPANINGVSFVFKSLNHHEFERLSLTYDLAKADRKTLQKYHDAFLANGVLLVDGLNTLRNREDNVAELVEFFGAFPKDSKQRVVRYLSEINRRANRAVMLIEPYAMENLSRLRWAQFKGLDLSSPAITGFEGSQSLGLNWGQLAWRALNYFEDLKENSEREWENAKFVASAMAGKGLSKVYSSDKRRRQSERDEKVERRDKILRHVLLDKPLDETSSNQTVIVARTVEDLTKQLDRDLKGEKDWHDEVVARHEQKIRDDLRKRNEDLQRMREEHIEKWGDRPVIATTTITGLTRKEVSERVHQRRQQIAQSLDARSRHPELTDPKYADFSKKWLQREPISQKPVVTPTGAPQRPRAKPFRRS